jgi:hypothetical protein
VRIVLSDSDCLCDLRKASLLDAFLRLPHEILITNVLLADGCLDRIGANEQSAVRSRLTVVDLPGERVARAVQIVSQSPQLSVHDGLAAALAETCPGCVLLASHEHLRNHELCRAINAQELLWVVDEIFSHRLLTAAAIVVALKLLMRDRLIRARRREWQSSVRRYEGEA